jgi:hypothetical protein
MMDSVCPYLVLCRTTYNMDHKDFRCPIVRVPKKGKYLVPNCGKDKVCYPALANDNCLHCKVCTKT